MDVLADIRDSIYTIPIICWIVKVPPKHAQRMTGRLRRAGTSLTRVGSRISVAITKEKTEEATESTLPVHNRTDPFSPVSPTSPMSPLPPLSPISDTTAHQPTLPSSTSAGSLSLSASENAEFIPGTPRVTPKSRFTGAVRSVMMLRTASAMVGPLTMTPRRQRTTSSTMTPSESRSGNDVVEQQAAVRGPRGAALVAALKSLEPTQDLPPHQALVRHLQFSPNGKFLATCRCVAFVLSSLSVACDASCI